MGKGQSRPPAWPPCLQPAVPGLAPGCQASGPGAQMVSSRMFEESHRILQTQLPGATLVCPVCAGGSGELQRSRAGKERSRPPRARRPLYSIPSHVNARTGTHAHTHAHRTHCDIQNHLLVTLNDCSPELSASWPPPGRKGPAHHQPSSWC